MLQPDITHTYYLKEPHAYYHETYKSLHIITPDGDIAIENLPLSVLREAIKRRRKEA